MSFFQPGDRVSFINDRLSGTVLRQLNKQQLLVRLDDGFEIPVDMRELVASGEKQPTRPPIRTAEPVEESRQPATVLPDKILLAFIPEKTGSNLPLIGVYLINGTSGRVYFAAYRETKDGSLPAGEGEIAKGEFKKLGDYPFGETEQWKLWHIQLFQTGMKAKRPVIDRQLKVKANNLLKELKTIPLIEKSGMAIALEEDKAEEVFEEREEVQAPPPAIRIEPIPEVIDLHFEKLEWKVKKDTPASHILEIQLNFFRNMLEKAIALHMPRIIFIHGVGNGILKNEIVRHISSHPEVEHWEEADPKKFGYGATAVYPKSR